MRLVIVGAGGTTRDLLGRLGERWDVAVVDSDEARLSQAADVREIFGVVGDGSSRVTLDRAGIDSADALVAAANDDEVNLEACRIALGQGLLRVAAAAADPERLSDYRQLGVDVFSPDRLAAHSIELELEPARVSAAPFAKGKAQALEFRITEDAPASGRPLQAMGAQRWLVAAVLRSGRLVVPHGDTVLHPGDLVTVVGAAADTSLITRAFTTAGSRFPIEFGHQVAVAASNRRDIELAVPESVNLVRNSAAESLLVLRDSGGSGDSAKLMEEVSDLAEGIDLRERPASGSSAASFSTVVGEESVGVVVVPIPRTGRAFARTTVARVLRSLHGVGRPVLFAAGLPTYGRIVVHASIAPSSRIVTRAATDLAAYSKTPVVGLGVIPTKLISGDDDQRSVVRALRRLREEAAALGVEVQRRLRRGSLQRALEEAAPESLVVLPWPARGQHAAVSHLIRAGTGSVLLIPTEEARP